ncbi:alpha/beta fold hydrolase [Dongia sp.]|uniref:alpha/beta fold hydrolase n=1 Tax=Dongia sp. TaxID=1977262 RepID=UPI0035B107DF
MSSTNGLVRLFAKPWFDPLCHWGMSWLLPAARCWAAAGSGDVERFQSDLKLHAVPGAIAARVRQTGDLGRLAAEAQARWVAAAFGHGRNLLDAERLRRDTAHNYLGHRMNYIWFARRARVPAVQVDMLPPSAIETLTGGQSPDAFFALPNDLPTIEKSHIIEHEDVREYWLRFPSPDDASDTCWVHVYEGKQANVPSLIYGHGLAMEMEMMRGDLRGFRSIAASGCRILLPDAPGHNRRVAAGLYGGESFLRQPPLSGLLHFRQAARELGAIIHWCRDNGSRQVGLSGISLGALTAQVTAERMGTWPAALRPDLLLLLTTTDKVSSLTFNSSLAAIMKLDEAAKLAGWNENEVTTLGRYTDCGASPPIDPARIVLLIGTRDDVTPYDGGRRMAENWRIPAENLFVREQGHFSAAIGLEADPAPFVRALALLKGHLGA